MPQDPLVIEDHDGPIEGQRVLELTGPLIISNLFDFQARVRADRSSALYLEFSGVPYIDSAGIGALVGAHVARDKGESKLYLVGVNKRVQDALEVTRVRQFFTFLDELPGAGRATA